MALRLAMRLVLIAAVATTFWCAIPAAVVAQTNGTWNAGAAGTFNWDDAFNWMNGSIAGAGGNADFNSVNGLGDITVNLSSVGRSVGNLVFGDTNIGSAAGWTIGGSNTLTLSGASSIVTVNQLGVGKLATINAPLAGTTGLVKNGGGELALSNASGLSGGITINQSALTLNFAGSALVNNIVSNSNALTLAGGTLRLASGSGANAQTFAGTALNAGYSGIAVNSGTGSTNLTLGTITRANGGALKISPAAAGTISSTGSTIVQNSVTPVAGVGVLTGANTNPYSFLTDASGNLLDFGALDGAGNIVGATTQAGLSAANPGAGNQNTGSSAVFNTTQTGAPIVDFTNTGATGLRNATGTVVIGAALRFNTPRPDTVAWQLDTGSGGRAFQTGAVLVTANVGPTNVTTLTAGGFLQGRGGDLILAQDNPNGYFINVAGIGNGAANTTNVIKIGKGTVSSTGAGNYSGSLFLNEGAWMITQNAQLGAVATAAATNINGGTLVANAANVTLDNAGANQRPIVLGSGLNNTLAATVGNTLTVTGVVSDSVSGSPANLTIGAGTIVGSGAGTPNAELFGTGTVALAGANTYSGTTTINGVATLQINGAGALGSTSSVRIDGGTLQYATISTNGSTDISTKPLIFGAGGATIHTNGNNVTFANSIGGGGAGGLTKSGNGALTLGGANLYAGGTTLSAGTLLANNTTGSATGTGAVTVNAGTTLGGSGSIAGAVTAGVGTGTQASGGILAPGAGGIGTLTLGGLTAGADSLFNYEIASLASYDKLSVTGSNGLTFDGSSNAAFNFFNAGATTPWATSTGTFNLIQFAGAIQGNPLDSSWTTASGTNPHVLNRVGGLTYRFAVAGNALQLVIGGTSPSSWNINGNGNWGTAGNWSPSTVPNGAGVTAIFGAGSTISVTSPVIVTVEAPKTVGTLNFSNAAASYTVSGSNAITIDNGATGDATVIVGAGSHAINAPVSLVTNTNITVNNAGDTLTIGGAISGAAELRKLGPGALVLGSANPGRTGATTLSGGTLQLGASNSLGAGPLNVSAASTIRAGANLSLNNQITIQGNFAANLDLNGNTVTLGTAVIESGGQGALNITGAGTAIFTADHAYSGTTTIGPAATLQFGNNSATGSLPLSTIINNGAIVFKRNDAALMLQQSISGAGTVTQSSGGATTMTVNNTYTGATTISAGGTLVVGTALALQNSPLNYTITSGTLVFADSITAARLGNLSGDKDLPLMNTVGDIALTVGNAQASTYSGKFTDSANHTGSLIKVGAGTLTLSGKHEYGGGTTVTGGILIVDATGAINGAAITTNSGGGGLQLNGGSITVNNGAVSVLQSGSGGFTQTAGTSQFNDITLGSNLDQPQTLFVSGGNFTAGNLNSNRGGLILTAEPATGSATDGILVSNTANVHFTGSVNIGNNAASSVSMRLDGGSTTIDGALNIMLNNAGRWSVVDVNGGSLAVTGGIQLGGAVIGNALFLVRAGTATTAGIVIDLTGNQANVSGIVNLTGGNLYVGANGITRPGVMNATLRLGNGLLGAAADWASDAAVPISLTGDAITGGTLRAADAGGLPHNITINGIVSGTGALTKSGGGIVTLTNTNTYTGPTNISQGTLALGIVNSIATTPSLVMAGGKLATGGFDQAMPATSLRLTSSSAIDMSTGARNALKLANSNSDTTPALAWTAGQSLSIINWTGTPGVGGTAGVNDQVFFGADGAGLATSQIGQIHFAGFNGAKLLSTGEVVPLTVSTRKLGDFTFDAHVNAADISAMLTALRDLRQYRTANSLTADDFLNIGDLDADGQVTNADLQGLLSYLIAGNGSVAPVPEPAGAVMLALGGLLLASSRRGWKTRQRA